MHRRPAVTLWLSVAAFSQVTTKQPTDEPVGRSCSVLSLSRPSLCAQVRRSLQPTAGCRSRVVCSGYHCRWRVSCCDYSHSSSCNSPGTEYWLIKAAICGAEAEKGERERGGQREREREEGGGVRRKAWKQEARGPKLWWWHITAVNSVVVSPRFSCFFQKLERRKTSDLV